MTQQRAPRIGAITIVVALAILIAVLPRRYQLVGNWFAWAGIALMITPMLVGPLTKNTRRNAVIERIAEFTAVTVALLFNITNLLIAAYNLVENPAGLDPNRLFYTSIAIWVGNVLIFTLYYWLIDSGGPDARLRDTAKRRDFVFPAMEDEKYAPPDWRPSITDYLFLAFTTSTAFSPTEAMPMTDRAKWLVMLQSFISLVTIAIVAARTINILQ